MLLYTKLAAPKVPKRRSRAGCTSCKEKKKKCDEARPRCRRCGERGSSCVYEPVKPRQRRKRESFVSCTPFTTTVTATETARSTSSEQGKETRSHSLDASVHRLGYETQLDEDDWAYDGGRPQLHIFNDDGPHDICDSMIVSPLEDNLADIINPLGIQAAGIYNGMPPNAFNAVGEEDSSGDDEVEIDNGQLIRRRSFASTFISASPSASASTSLIAAVIPRSPLSPTLAMIAPCPVRSPLLEFCVPSFSEFSERPNRRALLDHFCNVLSHLIVFREETGNPFQQLVLPLSHHGSPVLNAVYALASAHLEHRGVENGEKSIFFHNQAIQGLAKLIQDGGRGKVNRNEVLAAIMLLVYYEVLVQRGRSNIVEGHLNGALTVMCSNPAPLDSTGIFLERAFRFYDVIAALSFGKAPLSTAPAAGCLLPFPPLGAPVASPLNNIDTLLGMATTLWPVIHRLSGLLSLKSDLERARAEANSPSSTKVAVLRTEFETTSSAVEATLEAWTPSLPEGYALDPTDPTRVVAVAAAGAEAEAEATNQEGEDSSSSSSSRAEPTTTMAVDETDRRPAPGGGNAGDDDTTDAMATNLSREKGQDGQDRQGEEVDEPEAPREQQASPRSYSQPQQHQQHQYDQQQTSPHLHSILNNALAYRHSSLLYLYRTIRSRARTHPLVQLHTRLALRHCVATVSHAGPMSALLWPLFVAACEAVTAEDRALARTAFEAIDRRQGMTNIERAWDIVQEVWRRADLFVGGDDGGDDDVDGDGEENAGDGEGVEGVRRGSRFGGGGAAGARGCCHSPWRRGMKTDLWRRVSEDMGVSIVFG